MFYTYHQNNSGGSFKGDIDIIIEADSAVEANLRAVNETDIYFDGCQNEIDCDCCGDRWSPADDPYDADEVPSYYGKPLEISSPGLFASEEIPVYYKNGEIKYLKFGRESKYESR